VAGAAELNSRLPLVKAVVLDVDGVLTDGQKLYSSDGLAGLSFDGRDGLGVYLLNQAGLTVVLMSNGSSEIVRARARDLGIECVFENIQNKAEAIQAFRKSHELSREQVLYVGDDLWDIPAFAYCGVTFAVADAIPEVCAAADAVTVAKGGRGAVREIADLLLAAHDLDALQLMLDPPKAAQ
jgi:3-deoxy-D-manno-octulosonate 8-phosphate phosphatase (KDO 8-P phosphatase)